MKIKWFLFSVALALLLSGNIPAKALTTAPQIAPDKESGYDRSLFKHWIDANKNGCDTRAEVLIAEAVVKPKKDKKCKLTGGKWLSAYDGKTLTDASKLDVDHLVPLAEAWRSGAWAWTAKQRQDFANDLSDSRALIAVTLTTNRSKSDQDISDWVPKEDPCGYVKNWIAIKVRYSLTYDAKEAASLTNYFDTCNIGDISVSVLSGYAYQSDSTATPKPNTAPAKFKMPFILGEGKIGTAISKWASFGFTNPPIVVQAASGIKEYSCKPKTDEDWILEVSPPWNSLVDAATQVTITTMCTIDVQSSKSPTPSPVSTPTVSTTPTPTVSTTPTPAVSTTPTPNPTVTPTASPTQTPALIVTPGAFCSPAGAIGKSSSGVTYTCKTSATETRNRWRP
jgi:hypothetical protein